MTDILERSPRHFVDFFNLIKDKDFAVSYFGDFSMDIKNAILADVRRKLDLLENKTLLKKRIYSIADESFDNIINYAKGTGKLSYQSLFALFREQGDYVITIGNQVSGTHIEMLKERMNGITRMNEDELTKEYKQVMTSPMPEDAQGAGLGIIIMALRSGNQIDHIFEAQPDGNYFFILRIKIS